LKLAMFDFVGTLGQLAPTRENILIEIMNAVGEEFDVSPDQVRRVYLKADSKMPYSSLKIRNSQQRQEFYTTYNSFVLEQLGFPKTLSGESVHQFFLQKTRRWELVDGAVETLDHFRDLGFRLAVLSNFDSELESVLVGEMQLKELVDDVVSSGRLGIEKPNLEFFNSYLKRFDFDRSSSFYVGDSYELDYLPAQEIGLRAFLVDPYRDFSGLPGSIPTLHDLVLDF
jgi:FMN phosphatase YigB (HAD superfamily)